MSSNQADPVLDGKNGRLRLASALLIAESLSLGCGGLVTMIYAIVILVVAVVSGLQYLVLAMAAGVLSGALIGLALALWALARKLRSRLNRWTLIALAIQMVFAPIGYILFGFAGQARPTDNPFSEGGDGYVVLLGFVLAACGTVAVIVLLWESATSLQESRRS